jgi:hypothetical protein
VTRTLAAAVLLLSLECTAMGQSPRPVSIRATTPPLDSHFEIFQSEIAPTWTLRLDRVTGNIDQMVSSKTGNIIWVKMRILPHPRAVNIAKPHFQILAADTPIPAVLLLDTESGATWQLMAKENSSVWQPIE